MVAKPSAVIFRLANWMPTTGEYFSISQDVYMEYSIDAKLSSTILSSFLRSSTFVRTWRRWSVIVQHHHRNGVSMISVPRHVLRYVRFLGPYARSAPFRTKSSSSQCVCVCSVDDQTAAPTPKISWPSNRIRCVCVPGSFIFPTTLLVEPISRRSFSMFLERRSFNDTPARACKQLAEPERRTVLPSRSYPSSSFPFCTSHTL